MVGAVEIGQRLLCRLAGTVSAEDLGTWAKAEILAAGEEGPTIFDSGEALRLDILKRVAVAVISEFALSEDEILTCLRRLAFSDDARGHRNASPAGRFLAGFPARGFPDRLFPVVGSCARCGAPVRISRAMIPAAGETRGALLCFACARRLPGTIVER